MALTLPEAAFARKAEKVRQLLAEGAPVDTTDRDGRTALHYATMVNELEIVELLLTAGAQPDRVDSVGDMPLHFASQHVVRLPILRLLLERAPGVVDKAGGGGRLPLCIATDAKVAEGVRLLLEHGADPAKKDATGQSAIDRAQNTKIRALLTGGRASAPPSQEKSAQKPKQSTKPRAKSALGHEEIPRTGPLSSLDAWERASDSERSAELARVLPPGFAVSGACGASRLAEVAHSAFRFCFVAVPGGRYVASAGDRDREALEALDLDEHFIEALMASSDPREVELPPMLFARQPKSKSDGSPCELTKEEAAEAAREFESAGLRMPTEDEWNWVARTCGRTTFIAAAGADEAEDACGGLAEDFTFDPAVAGPLGVWGLLFGEWVSVSRKGAPAALMGISGAAQNYPFQEREALAGCLACVGPRPAEGEKLAVRAVRPLVLRGGSMPRCRVS